MTPAQHPVCQGDDSPDTLWNVDAVFLDAWLGCVEDGSRIPQSLSRESSK